MPPELAELRRWLEKADHDLRTAEVALDLAPPVTDTAGFHCQQAVEKLLKTYLVSKEKAISKNHDLRALTLACSEIDQGFTDLLTRVGPLTGYAVRFRYPGPNDPSVPEIQNALAIVREVRRFVLRRLPTGTTANEDRDDALDLD